MYVYSVPESMFITANSIFYDWEAEEKFIHFCCELYFRFNLFKLPSSGAALNNFQCFFWIKLIALITRLQYYKLKPLHSLSFPDAKTTASLRMHFCQINTNKVVQSCLILHQNGATLNTKRGLLARKTYSDSSC